jgi:hypothetical protein
VSTQSTRFATQPDALVFVDGRLVHETTGGSFAVPMAALPPGTLRVLTAVPEGYSIDGPSRLHRRRCWVLVPPQGRSLFSTR